MITIPGELYSSKNSRRVFKNKKTGKIAIVKSSAAVQHESDLLKLLPALRRDFLAMCAGVKKPLHLSFKIYRQTARRFDYVNIIQNLLDCMVSVGWLDDDNADELVPYFPPYEIDRQNPRVEIEILNKGERT